MRQVEHTSWRRQWERLLQQWLDNRAPRASQFRLNRKNLYTFPSLTGCAFIGLTLVLWMLGTNYQNNLILALAYTLISVFVVAILHGYLNLAAMDVRWVGANPGFAGEHVEFLVELSSGHKAGCENVELRFAGEDIHRFNLDGSASLKMVIPYRSQKRGYLRPGRLLIQSYYPLGIIRCWTWLNLDAQALVYPAPQAVPEPVAPARDESEQAEFWQTGGEDFSGLKTYQPGDPIKHIAWKVYARDKGLFSKEYTQPLGGDTWLDWACVNVADTEQRLSGLCHWALVYYQQDRPFGLRLPQCEVPVGCGEVHLQNCLQALATFQLVRSA